MILFYGNTENFFLYENTRIGKLESNLVARILIFTEGSDDDDDYDDDDD